jgi:DnaJ-domain-containing protein 1
MTGLGDNYDIGLRLSIQEIPIGLREMLVGQLSQGFEQALARQQGDNEQMAELSKAQLEQLNMLIREADQLMFGININPTKRVVTIDTEFTAAAGTSLAEMYAGQLPIPSKFTAVLKGDPAIRYHAAGSVSEKLIESSSASIDMVMATVQKALDDQAQLGDDVKAEIEEMLGGLLDLVNKTMAEGKYDVGMIGVAGDNVLKLAGGMFVHDGDEVAAWVKKLDAKLSQIPDAPKFNFDESTYNGVTMHSVVIDIPERAEESRRLLGEKAVITLGTAPQAVYFAFGQGSVNAMKALIDSADVDTGDLTGRPLGQMRVKLLPFLRLAQSMKPNDSVAAVIDAVAVGGDNDYISVIANVVENGQSGNIEIGEGILKAIGAAVREAQNAQMREMQRGGGQF